MPKLTAITHYLNKILFHFYKNFPEFLNTRMYLGRLSTYLCYEYKRLAEE